MFHLLSDLGIQASVALRQKLGNHVSIPNELLVTLSSKPEFLDLQISGCLQLAKPLSKNPRELALWIEEALKSHPAIDKVEIAGPGYVNLSLKKNWLGQKVSDLRNNASRGIQTSSLGQVAVVDFSAPNIAKPMHIAHIRSTLLGDAIARILKSVGYQVVTDNHVGDWGTQFGKLLVAYKRWLHQDAYNKNPIDELVRLYQLFVSEEKKEAESLGLIKQREIEEDSLLEEELPQKATPLLLSARAELLKLQQGDPENLALWKNFVAVSLDTFKKVYQRLGTHFDLWLGESFYHPFLADLVKKLLQDGIAEISQGAVICPIESEPAPLLIRKADGAFLYGTTDLATIEYRIKNFNPSRILYVVGAPQQLHFRQVFSIAKKMGISCSLEHISFGSMRFKDSVTGTFSTGSTRKGNVPLLEDMLDEAVQRARQVVLEKNPNLTKEEIDEIANQVGIGAIKYSDLARDRAADVHFDLDLALSFEGNTAPYIQYAYARLKSIHRKAQEELGVLEHKKSICIELPIEHKLALQILKYPLCVDLVARSIRVHTLADYLYDLATTVSQFYHEIPVRKADPDKRESRLQLLEEAALTLKHGMNLLGIECPERM